MSPTTAGVADTSPPVVNSHFTSSSSTLLTLNVFSLAWNRVFCRLPPAEFQSLPPTAVDATPPSSTPTTAMAIAPDAFVIRLIEPSNHV